MRGQIPSLFARIGAVLPLMPLELVVARLVANALAARPAFAARLAAYAGRTFAIDPTDCPFCIAITLDGEGPVFDGGSHLRPTTGAHASGKCPQPAVRVIRDLAEAPHDARVAAPLLVLLGMLDGTYDGDALFFARDLVIEGDTDAVLALRNALKAPSSTPQP